MAKKIYDILPPKLAHKVENTIKDLSGDDKIKRHHKKGGSLPPKKNIPLKEILVGSAVIVSLLAIYLYTKLPKADIQVWPKMDTLTFQERIIADKSVDTVDLSKKVIPAQYMEEQIDSEKEFLATGSASNDGKASGIIKIYNKIDPLTPFTLIKGTHFLSDSGKYFVTLGKITIPAAKYQKGKLIPGSVDAKVEAKEVGEDYNVGTSKFSVPKLSGTSYYYSIYAESNDTMTGGYIGSMKKVTKDDIDNAKDTLTKELLSQAEMSLRNRLSSDDILLDGAILQSVIDSGSKVKFDTIIDKFNVQAKVKISALVFKKQDLEKIIKDNITSQLSNQKTLLEKSLNIRHILETVDMQKGTATLDLQSSVKTYYGINIDDLIDLFSMKSSDQIKEIIDQTYNDKISELKVNFWPFWVKYVPKDKNRIKINLIFE